MVSILILTYNEEKNIDQCLRNLVDFSDDVYILDSFSDDRTVEYARNYLDEKHILRREFDDYSSQRNWGLRNIPYKYDWLLMIDADEILTEEVERSIVARMANVADDVVGFGIKLRMHFMGSYLDYYLWPLERKTLFRFRSVEYQRGINEHITVMQAEASRWETIDGYLLHKDNKSLHDHFAKHNRYSTMEAFRIIEERNTRINWRLIRTRQEIKKLYYRMPFRKTIYFLYLFIFRLGLLNGKTGLDFIITRLIYQYEIDLKIKEINANAWTLDDYISFRK